MAECNSHGTDIIYPNLSATQLSDQNSLHQRKSMKLKIVLLQRLKKEN